MYEKKKKKKIRKRAKSERNMSKEGREAAVDK